MPTRLWQSAVTSMENWRSVLQCTPHAHPLPTDETLPSSIIVDSSGVRLSIFTWHDGVATAPNRSAIFHASIFFLFLQTTLEVQVEQQVRCVCLCVPTVTFERQRSLTLWPIQIFGVVVRLKINAALYTSVADGRVHDCISDEVMRQNNSFLRQRPCFAAFSIRLRSRSPENN